MRGLSRWAQAALVLVGATLLVGIFLPVPYVTLSPGPTFDVLADVDGEPVLDVTGARTYDTPGRLDLTTVSELGGTSGSTSLGSAVVGWLSPNQSVEPRSQRYPEGTDLGQQRQISQSVFDASASSALAAAATYLDRPVYTRALVSDVEPGSPADGALQSGDVLTSVAGQEVESAAQVGEAVRAQQAGDTVTVKYTRDGEPSTVDIVATTHPDGSDSAYLGTLLVDYYTSDFEVDLALNGIGGPSAGMVFAVGIVDKMTADEVVGGTHVAGTGTITPDGDIGPIGGANKKMIGAARSGAGFFIAPRSNCADFADNIPDGLQVAAVDTLSEALAATQAWRSGATDLPSCK